MMKLQPKRTVKVRYVPAGKLLPRRIEADDQRYAVPEGWEPARWAVHLRRRAAGCDRNHAREASEMLAASERIEKGLTNETECGVSVRQSTISVGR